MTSPAPTGRGAIRQRHRTQEDNFMTHIQWGTPPHYRVTAIFKADSACFDLPPATTFGDLADRVCHLSARNHGALVGVNVILAAQRSMPSGGDARLPAGGAR
jgi:hypothetical protein